MEQHWLGIGSDVASPSVTVGPTVHPQAQLVGGGPTLESVGQLHDL